ncbi:unnamed protein product [Thlaspi arvense]|uniref:Uncharacterized protein n=1 Tax=Thlaspi arvense TaxID=13288 RepID=A0AAU9RG91_THLAR|nr:unnamed protein product [Thlaspi arvense]
MALTLRRVMDTAKQVTKSGNLNEFSMVLLNNTLSLPLGVLLIFTFKEVDYLSKTDMTLVTWLNYTVLSGIRSCYKPFIFGAVPYGHCGGICFLDPSTKLRD